MVVLAVADGAFLHAAAAPDGDLCVCLRLHPLLRVAPRPNDEPEEVEALRETGKSARS